MESEVKGLLLLKSGRRVEGDLWKMEPKLDLREGMLSDGDGLMVDPLRLDEVVLLNELLRALERRAVKKGMFFVGAEEV